MFENQNALVSRTTLPTERPRSPRCTTSLAELTHFANAALPEQSMQNSKKGALANCTPQIMGPTS